MNARFLFLSAALVALVAAGAYHWTTTRTRSHLEAESSRLSREASAQRQFTDEVSQQLTVAQAGLQTQQAARATRSSPPSSHSPQPATTPAPRPTPPAAPPSSELRALQVQTHVAEQRLRFTALLIRLGFTAEKLQAFDRINDACQQVQLDESQSAAARQQARATRDAQLQELFGAHHDAWLDANRDQPARAVVAQIVQQTFQSSGALMAEQAHELTRIVARHRLDAPASGGHTPYDWDKIITDAHPLLVDQQREDFIAAVAYRRASEKMSAMAAQAKR
jgi:hypothetical protein